LAVVLAVAVLALVVATVVMQGAGTSATSPQPAVVSTSHDNMAPDARELNDYYYRALAERYQKMSPDGAERNEQASGG
jgi:hypothetical protein